MATGVLKRLLREQGVFANIRAGLPGLEALPQEEYCHGCALATLYINQSVEAKLKERLEGMIREASPKPETLG